MRLTTSIATLLAVLSCYSQQKEIDSIKTVLPEQVPLDKVKSLNELSWYYKNSDLDSAMLLAQQALEIGIEINSDAAISQSYNSIANAFEAIGHLDSALIYHNKTYKFKEQMQDSLGMASSLNNLGITYDELGNYPKSLESYFQALRIYESKSDDPYNIAMVLGNIGIVYKKQREYAKVIEYYQKALKIYEQEESLFGQMVTKGNMAGVLLLTGDYSEVIRYAEEAMAGYKEQGYTRYIPYMMMAIAAATDSLGQTLDARVLYLEVEKLHLEHDNLFELSNTLTGLASNYRKTGEFTKGIQSARKALGYALEIEALEFQSNALLELAKNLEGAGQYREAFTALHRRQILSDSLFEQNKTKQIFELQTQYETEKKEQQIGLQNAQLDLKNAQINRQKLLLYSSLLAIFLLVIIALLWRNRLKKKQQIQIQTQRLAAREAEINATISSQEKERARYARDLHDGFGQMISVLNLNLRNLEDGAKPAERQKVFENASKVIDEMYDELKNICFDLMPQTLIKNGLESGLREFTGRINLAGNVHVELNVFGLESRLSELQEISLYRITQEWINNVLKYSDANKITVQITKDESEITLLIEDNGTGFDKSLLSAGKGNGWRNLNTRANLINGELELESINGVKGNTLIVNAPSLSQHHTIDSKIPSKRYNILN
ncbi:MAG: sensor histidine kinase [Cyclobacteriaceae bacterium]